MKKKDYNILDGNPDLQKSIVQEFLEELTEEQKEEAMTDKYSYLDE